MRFRVAAGTPRSAWSRRSRSAPRSCARSGALAEDELQQRGGRRHHRPGVLRRRPAAGHEGRGAPRGARGAAPAQRADGGGARLRPREEAERHLRRLRPRRRHVRRHRARARRRRLPGEVHRRRQRARRATTWTARSPRSSSRSSACRRTRGTPALVRVVLDAARAAEARADDRRIAAVDGDPGAWRRRSASTLTRARFEALHRAAARAHRASPAGAR